MDPILLSRSNFLGLITYGGNKLNFSFGRVRGGQRGGGEDLNENKHIYIFAFIPLHHHITIYSPLPCLQYHTHPHKVPFLIVNFILHQGKLSMPMHVHL